MLTVKLTEPSQELCDLRRNFFLPSKSTQIVMVDESYFALKDDNTNNNSGFYISPECP